MPKSEESKVPKWYWDYRGQPDQQYGLEETYQAAAEFLGVNPVEDWGCGTCHAKKYFVEKLYLGIDQAPGYADKVVNLVEYRSQTYGILLRHVLEHNLFWGQILKNALDSCQRLALILFTPLETRSTRLLGSSKNQQGVEVFTRSLSWSELMGVLEGRFTSLSIQPFKTHHDWPETLFKVLVK